MDERPQVCLQAVAWAQRRIGGVNLGKRVLLPGPPVFDALDQRPAPHRLLGEVVHEPARLIPLDRRVLKEGKGVP